jgi:hypothetical protein
VVFLFFFESFLGAGVEPVVIRFADLNGQPRLSRSPSLSVFIIAQPKGKVNTILKKL